MIALGIGLGMTVGLMPGRGAWSPLRLNPLAFFDAGFGTSIDVGVESWTDRTGQHTVTQSTDASQPSVGIDRYGIEFDGVDDALQATAASTALRPLHDGTGAEMWCVFRADDPVSVANQIVVGTYLANTGAGVCLYFTTGGVLRARVGAAAGVVLTVNVATLTEGGTTYICRMRIDDSETDKLYVEMWGSDGSYVEMQDTEVGVAYDAATDPDQPLSIGAIGGFRLEGAVRNVLLTGRSLTDDEAARTKAWFEARAFVGA